VHDRINSLMSSVFDLDASNVLKNLTMEEVPKWDSLTHMDLITSIEKEFSIQLTLDEIMSMRSLDAIRGVVERKIGHDEQ
jgi:acyl carrier protein